MSDLALAMPSQLTGAPWAWFHAAGGGESLATAADRGLARALAGDWTSGELGRRVGDLRAYLALRAWLSSQMSGSSVIEEGRGIIIKPDFDPASVDPDRTRVVRAIGETQRLLAEQVPGFAAFRGAVPRFILTDAGDPQRETGAFPLVAAAIIAGAVAVTAVALAYCATQAAQVIDNALARNATFRELVQADAQMLQLVDAHAAAEQKAGRALPMNEVERAAVGALEQRQRALTERKTPAITEPSGSAFPWGLVLGAAAAVGGVFLLSK